jgi:hypothetical protein
MVHYSDPNHFAEEKPMAVNLRSSDPTRAGGGLQDIDEPSRGDDDALHYADDDEPPDRDEIIRLLTEELGFKLEDLENAPDETLRAILRSHGMDEVGLPEPEDEDEKEAFAEHFKKKYPRHHRAFSKYCSHADDASAQRTSAPTGLLGSGVSKDTVPHWDSATYRQKFAENRDGLAQLGILSPEMLKRSREGGEVFCGRDLPRQAKEGRPLDRKFADPARSPQAAGKSRLAKYPPKQPSPGIVRAAERFAESRIARGDGVYTGMSRNDYIQVFTRATPAQREEFLSAT